MHNLLRVLCINCNENYAIQPCAFSRTVIMYNLLRVLWYYSGALRCATSGASHAHNVSRHLCFVRLSCTHNLRIAALTN
jgi:hypothetical protein